MPWSCGCHDVRMVLPDYRQLYLHTHMYFSVLFQTLRVSTRNLITFGILFGTFIGSLGTIVVTNAPNGDLLKQYYLWGAANFNMEGVTTGDIAFSLFLFAIGLSVAISASRSLTVI